MICAFALRLSAGAVFLAGLAASSPAPALVEKVMTVCSGQLCPFFKPAFAVPAGWYEDHKTGMRLGVRLLVPLGESFDTAPAIIYATARHNLEGEDLAGAVAQHQESLRRKIPDVAITRLGDVAGANGSAFQQHEFVSPRLRDAALRARRHGDRQRCGRQLLRGPPGAHGEIGSRRCRARKKPSWPC